MEPDAGKSPTQLAAALAAARRRIEELEARLQDPGRQQRAEAELLDKERELKLTLDATTDGIWKWDFRTDELFFSPRYYTMLGYEPGEFPPTFEAWQDLIHPDDLGQALAVAEAYLATKPDLYENRFRLRAKSGDYRWMVTQARVVERDERGTALRLIGHHVDITERKQAEEDLEKIFSMSLDMICIADINTATFLKVNPSFVQTLGHTEQELLARPFLDFVHPDDVEPTQRVVEEQLQRGVNTHSFVNRYRCRDGSYRWLEWNSHPIVEQGVTFAVARDVTDRRQAEQEQRRLISLVENAREFIGLAALEGRVIYLNEAGQRLVGLESLADARSRMIQDFVPQEGVQRLLDRTIPEVLREGITSGEGHLRHFHSGELIPIDYHVFSVLEHRGVAPELIGMIASDISAREQARRERALLAEQLRQSQKMEAVGRLAGGIAHDFNNLLTGISGNLDLALLDLAPNEPVRQDLIEASAAVERAADLTRRLLAFSRKQIISLQVIELSEVVQGMASMLRRIIGEDIQLEIRTAAETSTANADTGQIEQIIMNLVVNARDAMPSGGTLTVETGLVELDQSTSAILGEIGPGTYVTVTLTDTGTGIQAESLDKIFEPFFTTKDPGVGTGLGLSMVFGMMRQHGGAIEVDSTTGRGSTFRLYLPHVEATREDPPRRQHNTELPRGTETVLVVEDEAVVRNVAVRILTRLGYRVLAATHGEEALESARAHTGPIQLLLTDVVMPGLNGRELADRLQSECQGLKVLFTSGYAEDVIAKHGVLDEGVELIAKPYAPVDLAQRVRRVLDD